MAWQWEHPWVLWTLAALPGVWLVAWRGRTQHAWWAAALSTVVRTIVLALLLVALAGPFDVARSTNREPAAVVFLMDRSASVEKHGESIAASISQFRSALPSVVRTVELAFAGTVWPASERASHDGNETDLEAALKAARARCPESLNRQIVLFTDGRATRGDALSIARQLHADGVPVHVCPVGTATPLGPRLSPPLCGPRRWPCC